LASRRTQDGTRIPALLQQTDNRVASISADGAYDQDGGVSARPTFHHN